MSPMRPAMADLLFEQTGLKRPPLGSGRTGAPDVRHPHAMAHSGSAEAKVMSLMRPTMADLLFEQTRK